MAIAAGAVARGDPPCHQTIVGNLEARLERQHILPDGAATNTQLHDTWDRVDGSDQRAPPAEQALDPYAQQENIIAPRWQGVPDTEEEESR